MPRVSLGLPVYNGERYLPETLDSILGQTFENFELVISDNASTDATAELCKKYAAADSRITYSRNARNIGGARNYNHVFALASAPYFKWQSHDDVIGDRYLELCVALLDEDPTLVMSYPQITYIDGAGSTLGTQKLDDLSILASDPAERVAQLMTLELASNDIYWAGAFGLTRRNALARTQLLGRYNAADQVLVLQLALLGKFGQVPEPLYFRRDHPEASMAANLTPREVLRWFDPDAQKRIILTTWKLCYEHLASVRRAKLGPAAEIRADYHVLRRFRRRWRNFPGDLRLAVRDLRASPRI